MESLKQDLSGIAQEFDMLIPSLDMPSRGDRLSEITSTKETRVESKAQGVKEISFGALPDLYDLELLGSWEPQFRVGEVVEAQYGEGVFWYEAIVAGIDKNRELYLVAMKGEMVERTPAQLRQTLASKFEEAERLAQQDLRKLRNVGLDISSTELPVIETAGSLIVSAEQVRKDPSEALMNGPSRNEPPSSIPKEGQEPNTTGSDAVVSEAVASPRQGKGHFKASLEIGSSGQKDPLRLMSSRFDALLRSQAEAESEQAKRLPERRFKMSLDEHRFFSKDLRDLPPLEEQTREKAGFVVGDSPQELSRKEEKISAALAEWAGRDVAVASSPPDSKSGSGKSSRAGSRVISRRGSRKIERADSSPDVITKNTK